MRLKKIALLLALLLAVSLLTGASAFAFRTPGEENDLDLSKLEFGDIVLVSGGDNIIPMPGDWDHAILYVGDGRVVESAVGGVKEKDASIIHESEEAGIFRVVDSKSKLSRTDIEEVRKGAVEFAKEQIGDDYSFRWLRWPGEKNKEADAWYCTELVWAAYKNNGIDINANPGYTRGSWYNVSANCIAESENTEKIAYAD